MSATPLTTRTATTPSLALTLAALAVLVVLGSAGCSSADTTSLVVEVTTDGLQAGTDLDEVAVSVDGKLTAFPLAAAASAGKYVIPLRFGVVPHGSPSDVVTIDASGRLAGVERVKTGARVGFVKGEVRFLRLTLERACLPPAPSCGDSQTCRAGACQDKNVDAATLPTFVAGGNDGSAADRGGADAPHSDTPATDAPARDAPAADVPAQDTSPEDETGADAGSDAPSTVDAPTDYVAIDTGPTLKTIGDPCSAGGECASGFCADKVCCNEACNGQCAACDGTAKGTCLVVTGAPHGTRAACTGTGACAGACDGNDVTACHYPGASVVCGPSSCTAGAATPAASCDGKGACGTPATVSCAPAPCNGTTCGQCSATNPCANGFQCDTGRCVPKLDPGQSCRAADQCKSGACQQDVCCDRACTGACESCNQPGHVGACTFLSGNVCRASAGACDQSETCSGAASDCPADAKKPGGTECRGASGFCDAAEACDGTSVGCPADAKKPIGTVCRSVAGSCDVAEACDGQNNGCPADVKKAGGTECRAAAGNCDLAESCDGNDPACPADAKKPAGIECRAAAGACDAAEACDGAAVNCPADGRKPAGTQCRAAGGMCDLAESCDGFAIDCPGDDKKPSGTECRAASGMCDVAESCDGNNNGCPTDAKKASGTECRAAAGVCDVAESCDGQNNACPNDGKKPNSTVCRGSAGACDVAEHCNGSNDCPSDSLADTSTACGNALGDCATVPHCSGTNASCPNSVPVTDHRICRASAVGLSDPAETCTGSTYVCPTDVKYVNRIANPEFDMGTANWTTNAPSDTFVIDGGGKISGTYSAKLDIHAADATHSFGEFLQLNQNLTYAFPDFIYNVAFQAQASVATTITVTIGDLNQTVDIGTTIQQFGPYTFHSGAGGDSLLLEFQSQDEVASSPYTVWIDRVEVYSYDDK